MAEESQNRIVLRRWFPRSLEFICMRKIADMLLQMNESKIDSQFPWLTAHQNPFISLPEFDIIHIMELLDEELTVFDRTVQKNIIKILVCKPLKFIFLSTFTIQQNDLLDILRTIASTNSKISHFSIETCDSDDEYNPWKNIPETRIFLKEYVKNMPSITHLSVNDVCDDELLEAVALGCPNLLFLEAESKAVTSEGLKWLCMKTSSAHADSVGCQNLKTISLYPSSDEDYLLEGIECLLLHLPNLHVLNCSEITLGKAIEKLHEETNEEKQLQLREFFYDGNFNFTSLPSAIAMRCPFISKLTIISYLSNVQLIRFEGIPCLKVLKIIAWGHNFDEDIAPFLEKVGKSLDCLSLSLIGNIDFNIIDRHCPYLTKLNCFSLNGAKISRNPIFRNLEELYLENTENDDLHPTVCIRIISNSHHLKVISLIGCQDLNKNHVKEILMRNSLANLTRVHISSVPLWIEGNLSDLQSLCN